MATSKFIYILDNGHGGIINGKYVTPGKRSPMFDDGSQLFEGVYNRDIVNIMIDKMQKKSIEHYNLVPTNEDVPLARRINQANIFAATHQKTCMYISIHGNAHGDGLKFTEPSGIEIFTSPGQTRSDVFASIVIDQFENDLSHDNITFRKDLIDGDKDKEANLAVCRDTNMPAILCELGFMTNFNECKKMMTDSWKEKMASIIIRGIERYEKMY